MTNEDKSSRFGKIRRRKLLTSVGAASLALGATNVVQARSNHSSDVIVVKGNPGNPVSQSKREEAFQRAANEYHDRGGDEQRIDRVRGEAVSGNPVVGHGVYIDDDGIPHYYTGSAADERAKSNTHKRLEQWRQRWQR